MKKLLIVPSIRFLLMLTVSLSHCLTYSQYVGVGLLNPAGKLHIKGSADVSQLIIEANAPQTNINPLIRVRQSNGTDLMWLHSDDSTNVFLGLKSGRSNVVGPQGVNNTFLGSRSGFANTNGRDNTVVGNNAFFSNTKGSQNTAIGSNALFTQSFSPGAAWYQSNNVAVGYEALYSNQPTSAGNGANNTAVGTSSLRSNITGAQNTGMGAYVLYLNTTGNDNTAIGYAALNTNTTGNDNTAIGRNALFSNLDISENIAIGNGALYSQSTAPANWQGGNVAIGKSALYANYPITYYQGANNTAIGNYALTSNISGSNNIACGNSALHDNIGGSYNTAIGHKALHVSNANFNTAIGWESLLNNTSGEHNTACGKRALAYNNEGLQNTGCGDDALFSNTTGDNNAALGKSALLHNIGGDANTAIGAYSGTAEYAPNVNNTVSIGNHGWLNGAQNQAFIGNASTAWIGGWVDWTIYSDARVKNNIREDVKGLDFITRLRPVTYNRSIESARVISGDNPTMDYTGKYDVEKVRYTGFLAQEVENAATVSGYDFSGLHKPKGEHDLYSLTYGSFVVPLVKAVQELSQMNQSLVEKNNEQDLLIVNLLQRIEKLEASIDPNN